METVLFGPPGQHSLVSSHGQTHPGLLPVQATETDTEMVSHLSVVPDLLGHSPHAIGLRAGGGYAQPQPGLLPSPKPTWPVDCKDALRCPQPHAHTVPSSVPASFQGPQVQQGCNCEGGTGCYEVNTGLWEPKEGLEPSSAVREGFLEERTFQPSF